MKFTAVTINLFLCLFCFAQTQPLLSKVYLAEGLKTVTTQVAETKNIFDGSGAILSKHSINALTLFKGKSIDYSSEKTLERFIIVKSGPLSISLNGSTALLDRGSVILVLPGDKFEVANKTANPASFYEMTYQSIAPPDKERSMKAGGSFMINWNDIAYKLHDNGKGGVRQFFDKQTLMLSRFDIHVTTLNEGFKSHDPHTHKNEEIILMIEGNGEMQIGTEHQKANGGDIVFLNSMVLHNITNIGKVPCLYFAIQWN